MITPKREAQFAAVLFSDMARTASGPWPLRQVVVFLSYTHVMKLTRQRKPSKRARGTTLVLTHGQPNYAERKVLKSIRKNGEPLPAYRYHFYSSRKK